MVINDVFRNKINLLFILSCVIFFLCISIFLKLCYILPFITLSGVFYDLYRIFATTLTIAAILFLILYAIFELKDIKIITTGILFIFSSLLVYNTVKIDHLRTFGINLNRALILMTDEFKEGNIKYKKYDVKDYGMFSKMLNITNEYFVQINESRRIFLRNFDNLNGNLDISKIIDENIIKYPYKIKETQKRLKESRILLFNYNIKTNQITNDYLTNMLENEEVVQYGVGKKIITEMRKGYIQSKKMSSLLDDKIVEIYDLLEFLLVKHRNYRIIKGVLVFRNDVDKYNYNNYITKIRNIQKDIDLLTLAFDDKFKNFETDLNKQINQLEK